MTLAEPPPDLLDQPHPLAIKGLHIALLGYRSSPYVGGQGIYLHYLSRALVRAGHRVDVYSGPPYPQLDPAVKLIKVPSLDLYAHPNHVRALRLRHLKSFTDTWEWWSMLTGGFAEPYTFGRRVERILRQKKYDIIHDNQSLCFGLLNLHKNHAAKVVATIHHPIHRDRDIALQAQDDWRYRLLIRRWYSFLSMQEKVVARLPNLITVSEASRKDIARHFAPAAAVKVISNGIDTEVFRPLPSVKKVPFRLITTASSDQPLKGLGILLQALAQVVNRFPEIHLRIIGKLDEKGDNRKLLKSLGLESNVSFVSGLSTEQLVEQYNRASMAVCPSLYEGFGLPAAEAMACGLAVISSDGGALPEVVGDAGRIVPAGEVDALVNAITQLFENPKQLTHMSTKGRQRIADEFCWQRVAARLTDYYQQLLTETC